MKEEEGMALAGKIEDLSGIRQELEAIWSELDSMKAPPQFVGAEPGQSGNEVLETDGLEFEVKLKRARASGDMLAALRVKQEAAKAGIVLY